MSDDFITIALTNDGTKIGSPMPSDETIVEVKLRDGTVRFAWFASNIMDAGDWDFVPIEEGEDEPQISRESIADEVVAWRPLEGPPLCEECFKFYADLPKKICPGCEAYREHQA